MQINAEWDLYRFLQQEMLSLEKDVNRVVLVERAALEKGQLEAGVMKQPDFLNVLGEYQHLAAKTQTGGFLANFKKAL